MDQQELFDLALRFRQAIQDVKMDRNFYDMKDRMNYFPRGCCDDSADLFGYYLLHEYHIPSKQGNGYCSKADTNHAFTILSDGTIIDLTADQFPFLSNQHDGIYVGQQSSFYRNLGRMRVENHFDITHDDRLWHDYQAIYAHL